MPSRSRPWIGEEVERLLRAAGHQQRVVAVLELLRRDVFADVGIAMEGHAFRFHLLHAPVDDPLLHLEVGDAVAQQAAGLGVLFVDVHVVAGARQLLGRGETGRARADDGDALAGLLLRRLRRDPAFLEASIGDGALDRLDGHRHVVDVERARGFARRRAHAAGHLGKVIGRVKVLGGLLPVGVEDEVVPVGDLIVDRAAGVAIGDAAVHAAGCLDLRVFLAQCLNEFAPMLQALRDGRVFALGALEFEEASNLAHSNSLSAAREPRL